ncbi:MAG TPA: LPXTG cell wall anchor domain-containing protein [Solirubrobacteraceae bacterium]|jgi:LPXTG-motif cell wall-anchored protein|nr:LPXTG cell wall anchor domain-containing protein [Solirubrobacteraceae bacterium]
MLRPRPLATVLAALALVAGALLFAPFASTRSGAQRLTPMPPVTLSPPAATPVSTPVATAPPRLPKTGLNAALVALVGLGLLTSGVVLRPRRRRAPSRRRG